MGFSSIIVIIIALLLFLAAFILIRTLIYARKTSTVTVEFDPGLPPLAEDPMIFAEQLSAVIKVETISHEDEAEDVKENFNIMQSKIAKLYPRTHKLLDREMIDGYSMLYTWKGKNPELDPVVFMAHQDVVPADEYTLKEWTHAPFSGKIADGFIWGRGTLDIKNQMIAIFAAVESLIINGFKPERTIMLFFSHNEEVLGTGAKAVVSYLKEKGVHVQAVIDEGGSIYDNFLPGVSGLAATIGIGEKGYLSLRFKATATGGHASTPSKVTAIGVLARAITRLESQRFPHNVKMIKPMFDGLGSSASFIMQMAFANLWIFSGIIGKKLEAKGETDATIRTTTAPTIFHAGVKDNVLPSVAEAIVNFRLLPGDSIADVCEFIRLAIKDDRVTFEPVEEKAWEASPLSPVDNMAYLHLSTVIGEVFPGTAVAPFLMLGGTDSRNFCEISDSVYRFSPVAVKEEDLHRVHGVNERIGVDALYKMVDVFYRLIPRWASKDM